MIAFINSCPRKKNIGNPHECIYGTQIDKCTCRNCRCGRCAICGFQKHMAIHGPIEDGSKEPWDHFFVPEFELTPNSDIEGKDNG